MWGVVGSLFLAPGQDRLCAGETDSDTEKPAMSSVHLRACADCREVETVRYCWFFGFVLGIVWIR